MGNIKQDLADFREMTEKFYSGEINVAQYKGFSGKFGSYAQRGGRQSMLRLRLPGGHINKDNLKFIADMIREYKVDKIHFTTCQTIQLHNLSGENAADIMEKAIDHGIITLGGGGDFPRNVMMSPLTGVERDEHFDVYPYGIKASEYLLGFINSVKLPRKLKVCFSNSPANAVHATFRDMGFVSTSEGNFDVYIAGGLGKNPKFGINVAKGVNPSMVLYYIKAMVYTFTAYGDYENRSQSRTRYLQDTLGEEGLREAYLQELAKVMDEGEKLDINIEETPIMKHGTGEIEDRRVIPQKQEGLYSVKYHPIGGVPAVEKLGELYEAIKDMQDVELRLSPDQTVYIINLNSREAQIVLDLTSDGAKNSFEESVSCIGASICQVGLRDSQNLLRTLIDAIKPYNFADGVLPLIHISGCPSSCGTHQTGTLGFHGRGKVVDKKPMSAFSIHVGGCDEQGHERMGDEKGVILERDIPEFMIKIGQAVTASGTDYNTWFNQNEAQFDEILKPYL